MHDLCDSSEDGDYEAADEEDGDIECVEDTDSEEAPSSEDGAEAGEDDAGKPGLAPASITTPDDWVLTVKQDRFQLAHKVHHMLYTHQVSTSALQLRACRLLYPCELERTGCWAAPMRARRPHHSAERALLPLGPLCVRITPALGGAGVFWHGIAGTLLRLSGLAGPLSLQHVPWQQPLRRRLHARHR